MTDHHPNFIGEETKRAPPWSPKPSSFCLAHPIFLPQAPCQLLPAPQPTLAYLMASSPSSEALGFCFPSSTSSCTDPEESLECTDIKGSL